VAGAAATIALVVEDFDDQRSRERALYDLGQTTMAMMIAAADQGVGSGHAGVHDQPKARQVLEVPDDRRVATMIDLGYPADRPLRPIRSPDRRPFEDVVRWERW
jgi:nitroreductase